MLPAHLLLAALGQEGGVAMPILDRIGMSPLSVRNRLTEALATVPKAYGGGAPQLSRALLSAFERAVEIEREMGDEYLSVEHVLVALAEDLGVDRDQLLNSLVEVRGSHRGHVTGPRAAVHGARTLRT